MPRSTIANPFDSAFNGAQVISNTTAVTGNFYALQVITNAVFTNITGNVTGYATTTFPAGFVLYVDATSVQLASGSVVAYNR
jgi:hypothetical protein